MFEFRSTSHLTQSSEVISELNESRIRYDSHTTLALLFWLRAPLVSHTVHEATQYTSTSSWPVCPFLLILCDFKLIQILYCTLPFLCSLLRFFRLSVKLHSLNCFAPCVYNANMKIKKFEFPLKYRQLWTDCHSQRYYHIFIRHNQTNSSDVCMSLNTS